MLNSSITAKTTEENHGKKLTNTRNSSIELLRIISILFIIISHLCEHGAQSTELPLSFNKIFTEWGVLGNLGVDIFVIITGFFMCEKSFSTKRLSTLFSQVWFYSICLAVVFVLAFDVNLSAKNIVQVLLPTIFSEYWFFTTYVILMLLSPFINLLIEHLDRSKFIHLLICFLVLWVFIPSFTTAKMYTSPVLEFIMFYLIGAYFRKHPDNAFSKKKNRVLVLSICLGLLLSSNVVINLLTSQFDVLNQFSSHCCYFYSRSSVLIVGIAVALVASAVYHRPFTNKLINEIASCTFGIYLIHDNPFVRKVLWKEIFNIPELYKLSLFPIYAIGIVLIIFLCCCIIEYIRLKTIAKPMSNLTNIVIDKVYKKASQLIKLKK